MTGTFLFILTIAVTLWITYVAAKRTERTQDFYNAGGRISAGQNGLAICGDFLSATTLLGTTAIFFSSGGDVAIYYISPLLGLLLMLAFIAGPMRRMGQCSIGDVLTAKLPDQRMRWFAGIASMVISIIYLVAQLVGAGGLISILFGMGFTPAVLLVGVLIVLYVGFGGMLAATWVQIVKAVLLMVTVAGLAGAVITDSGGLDPLYRRAAMLHPDGNSIFAIDVSDPFAALSLGLGLILGMMGLPHLLIRFFTVPDESSAKRSVIYAFAAIAFVFLLLFVVIGPACVAYIADQAEFIGPDGKMLGGSNMVILHLARRLGGEALFGLLAGVAFATILAVTAGLTVAAASAASRDLLRAVTRKLDADERQELLVFRSATGLVIATSVSLAMLLRGENVAVLAALAFAVAASSNFPVLLLAIYWPPLTAPGAIIAGATGLLSSVVLIVLGPAVWVGALHNDAPIFPYDYPTLVTVPAVFLIAVVVSYMTTSAREHGEPPR